MFMLDLSAFMTPQKATLDNIRDLCLIDVSYLILVFSVCCCSGYLSQWGLQKEVGLRRGGCGGDSFVFLVPASQIL